MKKLIVPIVVAVAGFFVWQQMADRAPEALSPEQRMVQTLDERIDAASGQISRAGRAAGMSGMDATSEAESALAELERVEADIQTLQDKAGSDEIRAECERLLKKVEAARR